MGANRNIKYIKGLLGDKSLDNYTSSDEASFRDYLLKKRLTVSYLRETFLLL